MRHSDSSPPIPPRFVAFARRYHPSTCGSLRRTPGATSTASGLVSRCPRPGGLYDGDDEASRVPGKPTRTHATRSDPGEVAASTASETRRDDLPSNARRRPSHSMHFGAQLRGLRAPCERFAPWVTPGPRITRFRLAADLGRMGLDTHRVSNKVSKITSRHLVPLDRAFPAHTLVQRLQGHGNRSGYIALTRKTCRTFGLSCSAPSCSPSGANMSTLQDSLHGTDYRVALLSPEDTALHHTRSPKCSGSLLRGSLAITTTGLAPVSHQHLQGAPTRG